MLAGVLGADMSAAGAPATGRPRALKPARQSGLRAEMTRL